uniref:PH domain-containing protein n=1 Tax=Meloidogyne javanica TaxID=6303 RepID=A0A915LEX5_MELJA
MNGGCTSKGDGVRKSGPIILLVGGKKRGQIAYAVLSERALELFNSEKSYRKKKVAKAIVDLSKCFNVSQQNCPKSRSSGVCLMMPDECFLFQGAESSNDTIEWYRVLLSAVISARALNLGRPVFANEFFECVWDVVIFSQQPKLKRSSQAPTNPEFINCPNICAKLRDEMFLAGRGRLCFYPHTIIICKTGIEPAHSGLPKAGIPPFRTTDFVEISRHFIAQFGCVERYFLLRIGRSSPMGSCEVWVQCESDDHAAEINRKLQEIIQRETEKKQQALQAIRGQQQLNASSLPSSSSPSNPSTSNQYCMYSFASSSTTDSEITKEPLEITEQQQQPILETISEDEQQQQNVTPSSSNNSVDGGRKRREHSSLSQAAREKRIELRECKAKVDSLEKEELEEKLRRKQQQAEWEVAQQRLLLPHYYQQNLNENSPQSLLRPNCLLGPSQNKRRGSAQMTAELCARSKSLSLEEQQALNFRSFGGQVGGRFWTMDKADSLLLLGAGYGPSMDPEETEDSGGTLRMVPCGDENNTGGGGDGSSAAPSRSSSSLNMGPPTSSQTKNCNPEDLLSTIKRKRSTNSAGHLIEAYVECHATVCDDDEEALVIPPDEVSDGGESSGTGVDACSSADDDAALSARRQQKQQKRRQSRKLILEMKTSVGDNVNNSLELDGGTEADQANGQLNPRAFSFSSSTSDARNHLLLHNHQHHQLGSNGRLLNTGIIPSHHCHQQPQQHPAAAKWTAAVMGGRNVFPFNNQQQQPPPPPSPRSHCAPSKASGISSQNQQEYSSSSSRFSMETSLITPLEEEEQQRQVKFADDEQLNNNDSSNILTTSSSLIQNRGDCSIGDDSLRKRAFSLGSKSWLTKPFRKLSSSHGNSSNIRQHNKSATSRSGSSSLFGSIHGDLCIVHESSSPGSINDNGNRLSLSSHRLCSISSCSTSAPSPVIAPINVNSRSDSIGSSHSITRSLPGGSGSIGANSVGNKQQRTRKKQSPSDEHLNNVNSLDEDLVELDFAQNSMICTTPSSASTSTVGVPPSFFGNRSAQARTNSCDDYTCTDIYSVPSHYQHHNNSQQTQCRCGYTGGSHSALNSAFPLQEVQCFIAPSEKEKIDAMTARDTLSLRSQRSGSGSCSQHFETINECVGIQNNNDGITFRNSSSRGSASSAVETQPPSIGDDEEIIEEAENTTT